MEDGSFFLPPLVSNCKGMARHKSSLLDFEILELFIPFDTEQDQVRFLY